MMRGLRTALDFSLIAGATVWGWTRPLSFEDSGREPGVYRCNRGDEYVVFISQQAAYRKTLTDIWLEVHDYSSKSKRELRVNEGWTCRLVEPTASPSP